MEETVIVNQQETASPAEIAVRIDEKVKQAVAEQPPAPVFSVEQVNQILLQNRPKTVIWFDYLRPDATRGSDRTFLMGVPDLRTAAEIEKAEQAILEQAAGAYVKVIITNWRGLLG